MDHSNESYVDPSSVSPMSVAIRYGVYWALAAIVIGLISHLAGMNDPDNSNKVLGVIMSLVNVAIAVVFIVLPIRTIRDQHLGGFITFGKAFVTGLWTVIICAIIVSIWTYVFMSFIAPELGEQIAATMISEWEDAGMSDDQIEGMGWMVDIFSSPGTMAIVSVLGSIISWGIVDLIVSAVMKKNQPMA